ncbi:hypothetical protein SDC9_177961 [bioreactor metagenome]|uniref:Uncharacterized protein n=1 Tax=bioreactor metagenome TaxID=1076179 RepID=A0A645GVW2_9ZZZZ
MQHADLDRIHANVFHHRVNLRLQHLGRNAVDAAHALRVLCGDGGDRRHAVAAQRAEGLEVGLNARAPAAVRTCDGQHARIAALWLGVQRLLRLVVFAHAKNYRALRASFFDASDRLLQPIEREGHDPPVAH